MKKFIRNIFLLLNLIPVSAILLSYLSVYTNPLSFWILAVLGLSYPFLLLANLAFMLLWLFFNPRYALLSIIAVLIGFSHIHNYIQFKGKSTEEKGIELCSFNVKNFYGADVSGTKMANAEKVFEFFQKENPDIICLQEVGFMKDKTRKYFNSDNLFTINSKKYRIHSSRSGGPCTYSSFPIIGKGEILFPSSANMVIYSDLIINDDTIRLFNCHLQSYKITPNDFHSLDSLSFNNQDKSIREVKRMGWKLKMAFQKRAEQAALLRQYIDESPYPVIVCGDFNDTPISYAYHKVRGNLQDAFVESGRGLGNSYLGELPALRIDYVLHSTLFNSYNFKVDEVQLSDHYPISCTLIKNSDLNLEVE